MAFLWRGLRNLLPGGECRNTMQARLRTRCACPGDSNYEFLLKPFRNFRSQLDVAQGSCRSFAAHKPPDCACRMLEHVRTLL